MASLWAIAAFLFLEVVLQANAKKNSCNHLIAPTNGNVLIVGGKPSIRSISIFTCNPGFKIVGPLASTCLETGHWSVPAPTCVAELCTIPEIKNGQLVEYNITSRYFRRRRFKLLVVGSEVANGTELTLLCENKRYEVIGLDAVELKVSCVNGVWSHQPICTPASCRDKPPAIENGQLITKEMSHGTVLTYQCNQNFNFMTTDSKGIFCDHGNWSGIVPICKARDISMKLESDASERFHVLPSGIIRVPLGIALNITCQTIGIGEWNFLLGPSFQRGKYEMDPENRTMKSLIIIKETNSRHSGTYRCRRRDRKRDYVIIAIETDVEIKDAIEDATEKHTESFVDVAVTQKYSTEILSVTEKETYYEKCFCIYHGRGDDLVAFADGKKLHFGSKVKKGETVYFHCKLLGHKLLSGPKNITCTDGCSWNSSRLPFCESVTNGEALMELDSDAIHRVHVLPSGIISIPLGIAVNITCKSRGTGMRPILVGPTYQRQKFEYESSNSTMKVLIMIKETNRSHSGKYQCMGGNLHWNHLHIAVQEPKLPVHPTIIEIIPSESSIHVKWNFSHPADSVVGFLLQWYDDPSNVNEYRTREFQNEFIIANLKPSTEYKIILRSLHTQGESDPVSAEMKTLGEVKAACSFGMLLTILPSSIRPNIEDGAISSNMSVGTTIKLTCVENGKRHLKPSVATCSADAQWVIPNDVECIPACGPIKKPTGSDMIIDPEKEIYRFGDTVLFFCPFRKKLNSSTSRIMCLAGTWSSNIVPHCIDY